MLTSPEQDLKGILSDLLHADEAVTKLASSSGQASALKLKDKVRETTHAMGSLSFKVLVATVKSSDFDFSAGRFDELLTLVMDFSNLKHLTGESWDCDVDPKALKFGTDFMRYSPVLLDAKSSNEKKLEALEFIAPTVPKSVEALISPEELAGLNDALASKELQAAKDKTVRDSIASSKDLLDGLKDVLPHLALRVSVSDMEPAPQHDPADFFACREHLVDINAKATAIKFKDSVAPLLDLAQKLHDDILHKQVNAIYHGLRLLETGATVAKWYRENDSWDQRRPRSESPVTALLASYRGEILKSQSFYDASLRMDPELFNPKGPVAGHFVDILDSDSLGTNFKQLIEEANLVWRRVSMLWTNIMLNMDCKITEFCPAGWEVHGEDLLEKADVLQVLHENEHYGKIGPMCDMIKSARMVCMSAHFRGGIVSADVLARTKKAYDHGVLTVTTTFVSHVIATQLAKMPNHIMRATKVKEVKEKIKAKLGENGQHGKICKSISDKLEAMEKDTYEVPTEAA